MFMAQLYGDRGKKSKWLNFIDRKRIHHVVYISDLRASFGFFELMKNSPSFIL